MSWKNNEIGAKIDTKMTARNAIILGFIISCAALLVNAVILSEVNNKLRDTETAYAATTQSLNEQIKTKDEGEKKFENYRLQSNLAPLLPEKDRENMLYDAGSLFHDSILYLYSAGGDLPMTEFRRAETEIDLEDARAKAANGERSENESAEQPVDRKKTEAEEFERAFKVLEIRENESGEIDYKAKHRAITAITDLIIETADAEQKEVRFERVDNFLNRQFVESYDKKQIKIVQLKTLRDDQSSLVNYSVFGSLVLQMLGLAFIFLKDFIQDRRS